jgi:hypothetical protein
MLMSGWIVRPLAGGASSVVLVSHFDPCGSIPAAAVDSINIKVASGVGKLQQYVGVSCAFVER